MGRFGHAVTANTYKDVYPYAYTFPKIGTFYKMPFRAIVEAAILRAKGIRFPTKRRPQRENH